jgi:hypothetical protein
VKFRLQKEELYKLGIRIFCSMGDAERAWELFQELAASYVDMSEDSKFKSKEETVQRLMDMEKAFTTPITFDLAETPSSKTPLGTAPQPPMGGHASVKHSIASDLGVPNAPDVIRTPPIRKDHGS